MDLDAAGLDAQMVAQMDVPRAAAPSSQCTMLADRP